MLELQRQVEIAGHLAVRSRAYFDLFAFYEDSDTRPKIINVMNEYVGFFFFEHHVHRYAFLVEISGLFKRKRGTINLPHLCAALKDKLSDVTREEIEKRLAAAEITAKKAEQIRNNAIAHRSKTIDFDDAFRGADVTRDQLKQLTVDALWISNSFARSIGAPEQAFLTAPMLADAKRLFTKLGASFKSETSE